MTPPTPHPLMSDLSRRRLLRSIGFGAAGVASASVLSSCAADDTGSGGATRFTGVFDFDLTAQTRNVAVEDGALLMNSVYADLFLPGGAFYNWETHEWDYLILESSVWEGDDLLVTLRPNLKWSDGTDLTAEDVHQNYAIQVLEAASWSVGFPQITELEQVDDLTVRARFDNPFPGIELSVIKHRFFSKSTYGDFGQRAIDMVADGVRQGDPEHSEFNAEFIEFNPDTIITSGPYTFDKAQMSDAQITLVREETGYQGQQVNFDEVVVHKGDNRQASLLIQQGEIDYSTLATSAADQQAFQSVEGFRWVEHPGYDGCGLMFNYAAKPELKDVRVRKALAHLLDGDQIGQVARGEAYSPVKYYSGMVDLQTEQVFSEEELGQFETYGHDTDRATELLEEAGWTKEGDVWHTSEGEPVSYEIIGVAGWGDFELTAVQVEEAWNAFGIPTTARNVPADNPWGIWAAGDFEVAVRHWGNPEIPQYWGAYQMNFLVENAGTEDAPGQSFDLQVESPSQGEVDLAALVEVAKTAQTEEEQTEALKTMAIVFNELLPRIPVWTYEYLAPAVEGVRVASFPDDHPAAQNQIYRDNHIILSLIQGVLEAAE